MFGIGLLLNAIELNRPFAWPTFPVLGVLQRICDERLSLIDRLSQQIQNERASNTQEKTAVQRLKAKVIERLPPAVRTLRNKLRGS